MIEIILAIALFSTALAGLWDLKTTEVPDQIPAVMIISGISYWFIEAASSGNYEPLLFSIAAGSMLLVIGLALYKKGQWGGADAWILAAIGYMIPFYNSELFIISYIFNFFVISAAYMIIYALLLGFFHKNVLSFLKADLRKNKRYFLIPFAALALFAALTFYFISLGYAVNTAAPLQIFAALFLLLLFWRYAKVVEEKVFKRRIPTSRLKAGDVLEEMNWVGLTKQQVASIRKRKKYVVIKEGVRFVPVFFLTLLATLLFGNLLFLFLGI